MANGHGGKRPGAGRKKKPLADKILEDTTKKHRPTVLNMPNMELPDLECPERLWYYQSRLAGEPEVETVWKETAAWLKKTGCLHLINPAFLEEYAIIKARFYELERLISRTSPVYDEKIDENKKRLALNPALDASLKYMKQADLIWEKIWAVVAQNCEKNFGGHNPHNDLMEKLLKMNMED